MKGGGGDSRYCREALARAAMMPDGKRPYGFSHAPEIIEELRHMELMVKTIIKSTEKSIRGKAE